MAVAVAVCIKGIARGNHGRFSLSGRASYFFLLFICRYSLTGVARSGDAKKNYNSRKDNAYNGTYKTCNRHSVFRILLAKSNDCENKTKKCRNDTYDKAGKHKSYNTQY